MNLSTIASTLVELLRNKQFLTAQRQLFADHVVSLEPEPFSNRSVEGLPALLKKEEQFLGFIKNWNHYSVSDPVLSKDHFSLAMKTEVELLNGDIVSIDEIIVYEVAEGKINKEQFFYR